MDYEIRVFDNLRKFKEVVSHNPVHRKGGEHVYLVLLNRKTGDMRFVQKISELEANIAARKREFPEEWKAVRMIVNEKSSSFELFDNTNHRIKLTELERLAGKVTQETIHLLNQRAKVIKRNPEKTSLEEAVLSDLSAFRVKRETIENFPGWMGSISRIEAEQRLADKPVGTYLLRKGDTVTESIGKNLSESYQQNIIPFLLSVAAGEGKVSEFLLLQTDWGWTLYRDDPYLEEYEHFEKFSSLLSRIHPLAKNPLL